MVGSPGQRLLGIPTGAIMSTEERPRKVLPTPDILTPIGMPLELQCGACGKKGSYPVGKLTVDPVVARSGDPDAMDQSFGFTGYFHCKHCGAGGPWHLTPTSRVMLVALMAEALHAPDKARITLCRTTLFDGTILRWPTQGEAHLKQLIDKDPTNYFLWDRLGNLYVAGGTHDLALPAFRESVRLEENNVEALHSIAEIHLERKEKEEAARFYHQVLLRARHAPARTPRSLLRDLLLQTIETLRDLHARSGRKGSLFPATAQVPASLNPNRAEDRARLVEWWLTGHLPPPPRRDERRAAWPQAASPGPGHVGRNEPCPCGSGKKFKNCCMRH
jgi:hypothetical protein